MDEQEQFEEFTVAVMTSFRAASNYHLSVNEEYVSKAIKSVGKLVADDISTYALQRGLNLERLIAVLEEA